MEVPLESWEQIGRLEDLKLKINASLAFNFPIFNLLRSILRKFFNLLLTVGLSHS